MPFYDIIRKGLWRQSEAKNLNFQCDLVPDLYLPSGINETDESVLGFPLMRGRAMILDAHRYQDRCIALGQGSA